MRFLKRTRGFSLLELCLVLAVVALLTQYGLGAWQSVLGAAQSRRLASALEHALVFARNEALLHRATLRFCPSQDGAHCSARWAGVWLLMLEPEETVLQVFKPSFGVGQLHWHAFPETQASIQFLENGATAHENGAFWYCPSREGAPAWVLTLGQGGRTRLRYPEGQRRLEDKRGNPLLC